MGVSEKVRGILNIICFLRRCRKHLVERSLIRLISANDHGCTWHEHILRKVERRLIPQMLLNCVKPAPESVFGDLTDLNVNAAISLANDRIEWKEARPRNDAGHISEINTDYARAKIGLML